MCNIKLCSHFPSVFLFIHMSLIGNFEYSSLLSSFSFTHCVAFSVLEGADSPWKFANTKSWVHTWMVCLSWLWPALRCVFYRSVITLWPEATPYHWPKASYFTYALTWFIACGRQTFISYHQLSSQWFTFGITVKFQILPSAETLMTHIPDVGMWSWGFVYFACQALAGPSLIKFKHLHPVRLCSDLPDISPVYCPKL